MQHKTQCIAQLQATVETLEGEGMPRMSIVAALVEVISRTAGKEEDPEVELAHLHRAAALLSMDIDTAHAIQDLKK
jgi:hypothetical protein